jgi:hypothetical protein
MLDAERKAVVTIRKRGSEALDLMPKEIQRRCRRRDIPRDEAQDRRHAEIAADNVFSRRPKSPRPPARCTPG